MRALQRTLLEERAALRKPRKRVGLWIAAAAAAVALVGTAVAATRAGLPWAWRPWDNQVEVTQAPRSATSRPAVATVPAAAGSTNAAPLVAAPAPAVSGPATLSSVRAPHSAAHTAGSNDELEEVNRLFAEAKRARREHRDGEALSLLDQLLSKHPRSVLVHEAIVERFRSLARLGRTEEAARAARVYLARYPTGFAAEEARHLAEAPSP
jgi:hypothetical protein